MEDLVGEREERNRSTDGVLYSGKWSVGKVRGRGSGRLGWPAAKRRARRGGGLVGRRRGEGRRKTPCGRGPRVCERGRREEVGARLGSGGPVSGRVRVSEFFSFFSLLFFSFLFKNINKYNYKDF
jgi:hypothetical protein